MKILKIPSVPEPVGELIYRNKMPLPIVNRAIICTDFWNTGINAELYHNNELLDVVYRILDDHERNLSNYETEVLAIHLGIPLWGPILPNYQFTVRTWNEEIAGENEYPNYYNNAYMHEIHQYNVYFNLF